ISGGGLCSEDTPTRNLLRSARKFRPPRKGEVVLVRQPPALTADLLLKAYALGVFPMAQRREGRDIYFVSPDERGIMPLDGFHLSRRLARTVRRDRFVVRIDTVFDEVIRACAAPAPGRDESWINEEIVALYTDLYRRGCAHTVECWRDDRLAGGLY